jgi:sphingosine-1-phosphate phosphatase 1
MSNNRSDNEFIRKLWLYIERLKDPFLVSRFQNYFGIECIINGKKLDQKISKTNRFKDTKEFEKCNGFDVKRDNSLSDTNSTSDESLTDSESLQSPNCVDYIIKNKFWYYLFCFGASLGYELFYASFFPIWFWNIDSAVGRRLVLVWVIVMYFGQALKDVIQWSRPTSPPVVILEPEYAVEYGMPSTHAMVGSALPVSLIIFTLNRYDVSLYLTSD